MSSGGGGMFSVNFILPLPLSFGGLPPSTSLAMKASSRVQRYNLADEVPAAPPRPHEGLCPANLAKMVTPPTEFAVSTHFCVHAQQARPGGP
jgi:hypothetical protein